MIQVEERATVSHEGDGGEEEDGAKEPHPGDLQEQVVRWGWGGYIGSSLMHLYNLWRDTQKIIIKLNFIYCT